MSTITRRRLLTGLSAVAVAPAISYMPRSAFASVGEMVGFRAYRNPACQILDAQIIYSNLYTKLLLEYAEFDTSRMYDAPRSRLVYAPTDGKRRLIRFSAATNIIGGAAGGQVPTLDNIELYRQADAINPGFATKVIKNGYQLADGSYGGIDGPAAGIGQGNAAVDGTVAMQLSGNDLAQPGDIYEVILSGAASPAEIPIPFPSLVPGALTLDINAKHHYWCGEFVL